MFIGFVFLDNFDCRLVPQCTVYLSSWVAAWSVRLFLAYEDRYHFLTVLGYDPPDQLCLKTVNRHRDEEDEELKMIEKEQSIVEKNESQYKKESFTDDEEFVVTKIIDQSD